MSKKETTFPRRGFALFAKGDSVEVRTVNVTGAFEMLGSASVTEVVTGVAHVLPLARVASETTLEKKKSQFAALLSRPLLQNVAGMTENSAAANSASSNAKSDAAGAVT